MTHQPSFEFLRARRLHFEQLVVCAGVKPDRPTTSRLWEEAARRAAWHPAAPAADALPTATATAT